MKKIFLFATFIIIFLLSSQDISALMSLCCPNGYSDSWWSCPLSADRDVECCKRNGFGNYSVVNKVQCPVQKKNNTGEIKAEEPVTKDVLDSLNPLVQESSDLEIAKQLSTPGGIVSRFLGEFAFPIAGLILFVMLIWGGIEMMAGSATSKSVDAGKQRVTTALLGFLLLFASFWIARILEMMFGIKIL